MGYTKTELLVYKATRFLFYSWQGKCQEILWRIDWRLIDCKKNELFLKPIRCKTFRLSPITLDVRAEFEKHNFLNIQFLLSK